MPIRPPEKVIEYRRRYYLAHREKIIANVAAYQTAHPKETKAAHARYRAVHKEKLTAKSREWKLQNPEKYKEGQRQWRLTHPEETRKLGREGMRRYVGKHPELTLQAQAARQRAAGLCLALACKNRPETGVHCEFHKDLIRKKYIENREKSMYNAAKSRAKKYGLPFDIAVTDIVIPTHCPALGMELVIGKGHKRTGTAPSLDRFKPELGYVKGNVVVISDLANRIKQDANAEQVAAVARWMETFKGART